MTNSQIKNNCVLNFIFDFDFVKLCCEQLNEQNELTWLAEGEHSFESGSCSLPQLWPNLWAQKILLSCSQQKIEKFTNKKKFVLNFIFDFDFVKLCREQLNEQNELTWLAEGEHSFESGSCSLPQLWPNSWAVTRSASLVITRWP